MAEAGLAKVKTFYESCTGEARLRQRADSPAINFLRKTFAAALHPVLADQGDLTGIIKGSRRIYKQVE